MNPDKAFSLVQMAAEKERLPHAYLLTGDPRERGWPLAAKIAGLLLCPEAQTPCGSCDTCRRIANRSHPDVLALEPEKKSRIISIEAMRETFLPWTSRQSFEGGWKVGIIVFADRLNDASANAFLKTLEEPPPRTLFLMLTDKPDALLPTIRSRCQCLDLSEGRVPPAEPWRTRVGQIMAQHANGTQLRVRATTARLQAMFDEISEIATTQTEEQAKALSGDPTAPAIDGDTLKTLISVREKELRRTIYDAIQDWYRDLLLLSSLPPGAEAPALCYPEFAEVLRARAARIPVRLALRYIDFTRKIQQQIEERAIRPAFVFQHWFTWMR